MADTNMQSREQLVDAMYRAVLDPECYEPFIEEWTNHIANVAQAADEKMPSVPKAQKPIAEPELMKHFKRASELMDRIGRRVDAAMQPLAPLSDFAISFNLSGETNDASSPALAENGDPLTFVQVLQQLDDDSAERLKNALVDAQKAQSGAILTLLQRRDKHARNQTLVVLAKRSPHGERLVFVHTLSIVWSDRLEELVSSIYALSPAETAVLRDVVDGYSLAGIADLRDRSLHTVRTHLRSIFRKTATSTQSEMIRSICAVAQFLEQDRPKQIAAEVVHPERGHFALAGGGRLRVDRHGPAKGRAVIFVHGMLDGTSMTREIEGLLYRHNINLLCPIRPGFDDAEPQGNISEAPESFAEAMSEFIKVSGLARPIMVGHMSGSVFTYAAAHYLGNQIGGVVNVSGGVPLVSLKQIREMTPRQRTIAYTAKFAPKILPTVLRLAISRMDRDTSLRVMHDLYPPGSYDRKIAREHALADLLYDGYRFAFRQGHFGFESDSFHVIRDWSELVTNCVVPLVHVHGTNDPVVTIKSVRKFVRTHHHVELQEHSDAGQLLFYQKPSAVFKAINSLIRVA